MTSEIAIKLCVFRSHIDILESSKSTIDQYWHYIRIFHQMEKDVAAGTNNVTLDDVAKVLSETTDIIVNNIRRAAGECDI